MATKYFSVRGDSYYTHLIKPDDYQGVESYKIGVVPDAPNDWNTIKDSGVRIRPKKTDTGAEYVTFRRTAAPKVGKDGSEFGGGKPLVLDKDNLPFDKLIGNGSNVEVIFSTYDSKMGKGHRLETVIVHKHVPYEPAERDEDGYQAFPLPSNWKALDGAPAVAEEAKGDPKAPVNKVPLEPKMPF